MMKNTNHPFLLRLSILVTIMFVLNACRFTRWNDENGGKVEKNAPTSLQPLTITPPSSGIQLPTPWASEYSNQERIASPPITESAKEDQYLHAPLSRRGESEGLLLTVKGETYINELAVSPSGSHLAIGEKFGLSLLRADTLERIWFRETEHPISSLSFSPDGDIVITGINHGSVVLWDTKTGDQLQVNSVADGYVSAIYSSDGVQAVTITADDKVHLWDTKSSDEILTMTLPDPLLKLFLLSPEAVLHAIDTNFSGIWNPELTLAFHNQDFKHVVSMALSPDRSILALGTTPITLWDTESGKLLNTLDELQYGYVNEITFAQNGAMIAFGTYNGSVYLWYLENDSSQRVLPTERGDLEALAISPDGTMLYAAYQPPYLFYGSESNWLVAWDINARDESRSINLQTFPPLHVFLSTQEVFITTFKLRDNLTIETWKAFVGSESLTLVEWIDVGEWNCVPRRNHPIMSMDGTRLASAGSSCDDGIVIWDIASGDVVQIFPGLPNDFFHFGLSPDGSLLLAPEGLTGMALWDVQEGEKLYSLQNISIDSYLTPVFSPDGSMFAFSDQYGDLYLYATENGERILSTQGQQFPKIQIAFSHDGSRLATGGQDGTFMTWNTGTGELISQGQQGNYVLDIAFSPDGSTLTTSSHGEVFFWDVDTLELFGSVQGHAGKVSILGFSPDVSLMLTMGMENTLMLWNLEEVVPIP